MARTGPSSGLRRRPINGTPGWYTRGAIAAVVAGLAFWMISDIWLGAYDPGPLYWRNLASWCVAFFPGFTALLLQRTGDR